MWLGLVLIATLFADLSSEDLHASLVEVCTIFTYVIPAQNCVQVDDLAGSVKYFLHE